MLGRLAAVVLPHLTQPPAATEALAKLALKKFLRDHVPPAISNLHTLERLLSTNAC